MAYVHGTADVAWESMRAHGIAPTPRHYEIWYTYCAGEKRALTDRLDGLLRSDGLVTPGLLDELYREFFATAVDLGIVRDSSGELQQIATEMVDRVSAGHTVMKNLGNALSYWTLPAHPLPTPEELARTAATLSSATTMTGERLAALERLFAASIARINELQQKLAKAEHDASCDALTGLANRRNFDASLRAEIQQAAEQNAPLTLLMIDLDHFKRFNDTYGHRVGDHVLRLVGRVLVDQIKGHDIAARYGGEEFAVILPNTDLAGGLTVGEQLRRTLAQRAILNQDTKQKLGVVTCSIGVAHYVPGMLSGDLIDQADRALYRAKQTGRNKVLAQAVEPVRQMTRLA
jgi:diguanylate cyclase